MCVIQRASSSQHYDLLRMYVKVENKEQMNKIQSYCTELTVLCSAVICC